MEHITEFDVRLIHVVGNEVVVLLQSTMHGRQGRKLTSRREKRALKMAGSWFFAWDTLLSSHDKPPPSLIPASFHNLSVRPAVLVLLVCVIIEIALIHKSMSSLVVRTASQPAWRHGDLDITLSA